MFPDSNITQNDIPVFTKRQEGMGAVINNDSEVSKHPEVSSMNQDTVKDSVSYVSKKSEDFCKVQRESNYSNNDGILEVKKEASPYGSWMLIKRPPRKKTNSRTKKTHGQVAIKPNPEVDKGSRFSLLQDEKQAEDSQNLEIGKKVIPQSKVIRLEIPRQPSLKSVNMEASSSKVMLGVKKQPEPNNNNLVLEARRKMEQDHLLTMKLISKEAAKRRDILFQPRSFSIGSGTKFIHPKPPNLESEENSAMGIC
ncbi:hypothetical protein SESBI_22440 [Sesbania bispinosa]|nr:hypothetical protein SESBI_22440 [Sesbania bispinosa]